MAEIIGVVAAIVQILELGLSTAKKANELAQDLRKCCEVGSGYCRLIATTDLADLLRTGALLIYSLARPFRSYQALIRLY